MSQEIQKLFPTCFAKQQILIEMFQACSTPELKYQKIIELGRPLSTPKSHLLQDTYLVQGCQSQTFLLTTLEGGKARFEAHSQALISAGLAALLISTYQDESPQAVLACPPFFIKEINLLASLSPSRSNGLQSMYSRIKSDIIKLISK